MFVVGYALQRGLLNQTLSGGLLPPLLVTFGISVIIQNGLLEAFGAYTHRLQARRASRPQACNSRAASRSASIRCWYSRGGASRSAACSSCFIGPALGRAFRAASDDADTAELMGIDNRKLYAVALGIAMIFTAIAGVLLPSAPTSIRRPVRSG